MLRIEHPRTNGANGRTVLDLTTSHAMCQSYQETWAMSLSIHCPVAFGTEPLVLYQTSGGDCQWGFFQESIQTCSHLCSFPSTQSTGDSSNTSDNGGCCCSRSTGLWKHYQRSWWKLVPRNGEQSCCSRSIQRAYQGPIRCHSTSSSHIGEATC